MTIEQFRIIAVGLLILLFESQHTAKMLWAFDCFCVKMLMG